MSDDKDLRDELSRRDFLKKSAMGVAAVGMVGAMGLRPATAADAAAPTMPMRTLGKTGIKVSLLGFGGGSQFIKAPIEKSDEMLEQAILLGINYFDTAESYGKDRESEKRYARVLPKHRNKIFLTSKTEDRTYDGMMRSVEKSLEIMKTDHLDLMQIHAANKKDKLEEWESPTGALTALRKLKEQKVVRFIGFTGHDDANVHKAVIEKFDFDTVLMALNAAQHKPFREIALPAAEKKGMGIIAMKTTRGLVGEGDGKATAKDLLNWTYDLPISTAIIGMESLERIKENIEITRAYKPDAARQVASLELTRRLAPFVTAEQLGWAMPGYRDACIS